RLPDHGHETTSEAFSYYIYLEAMYGAIAGDFSSFNTAWDITEKYIIPTTADQPTNSGYSPSKPATYAPELDQPSDYPSPIDSSVSVGQDPIYQELVSAYGSAEIYGMHWLLDVDNVYGFGNSPGNCEAGPSDPGPSYINTFQRGPEESVWRTIPQPTCDSFKYGGTNGFLDLFVDDSNYAEQWKFTNAPDADARAIQAAFWASQWATASGQISQIQSTLDKAAKMGDYLRYALFDKYFKKIGNCVGASSCAAGSGKDSAHYLLSWYYAWGGSLDTNNGWAWRIGDGAAHFGYQNPLAAYALSNEATLKPKGATAVEDWATSLDRQLEFYEFLQTSEGAFAGGATNSWKGRYDTPDSNLTSNTFHGMFYDWEPVYHDPPSNRWYGMQPWSLDRLAQYYYVTGSDLHVTVETYNDDVGTGAATARALAYYAAKSNNDEAKTAAKNILDVMWNNFQTTKGVSVEEPREDYSRFNEAVYVPSGWTGTYPNGDVIDSSATFIGIRSFLKDDAEYSKVETYLNGGAVPTFTYHRFWSQTDVAIAQGAYGLLFNE
ncbi:hypothetical protein NQ317_018126, partial [Molorchus minor]